MKNHYTFGDNDRAADRLVLLAQAFEPSSARLLAEACPSAPARALDLGCGPGETTELVHRATGARETWGLDSSARLLDLARARLAERRARGGGISFAVHDITQAPFPLVDADVAYARYVLTHLASPRALLTGCATGVRAGGRLVLEESSALESKDPLFIDYYARVAALQRHYGQDTYIGRRLAALAEGTPWRVVRFEQTPVIVPAAVMARLHAMNVRTWKHDAFFHDAPAGELLAMTDALDAVAEGTRAAPPVTCVMGQIVLART
jgi:SAM-dependent methyltransferase